MKKEWAEESKFRGVDGAVLKTVIVTQKLIGDGTAESPMRHLTQIWDTDGKLLASSEPLNQQGAVDPAFRYRCQKFAGTEDPARDAECTNP